jgi:hypothetical protein
LINQALTKGKHKLDDEVTSLRKEVVALQIMKANYEKIVESQLNRPEPSVEAIPDAVKFEVSFPFYNFVYNLSKETSLVSKCTLFLIGMYNEKKKNDQSETITNLLRYRE